MATDPLEAIDEDLSAACHDRHEAWRKLAIKDTQANRDMYAARCADVDALLEMRWQYAQAERMVDAG